MYKIEHYCSVSVLGTAVLLEEMIPLREQIKKLIVASSMSIYGEGAYLDADGNAAYCASRSIAQLKQGQWEPRDGSGRPLVPIPTPETKPLRPDSIYAVNKRDQEEMCLAFGRAYGIPAVAFRMFNVFALGRPFRIRIPGWRPFSAGGCCRTNSRWCSRTAINAGTSCTSKTWRGPTPWRWRTVRPRAYDESWQRAKH